MSKTFKKPKHPDEHPGSDFKILEHVVFCSENFPDILAMDLLMPQ